MIQKVKQPERATLETYGQSELSANALNETIFHCKLLLHDML